MDWISTWTGFGRNSEVVINLEALIHTHSKSYNLRERIFVDKPLWIYIQTAFIVFLWSHNCDNSNAYNLFKCRVFIDNQYCSQSIFVSQEVTLIYKLVLFNVKSNQFLSKLNINSKNMAVQAMARVRPSAAEVKNMLLKIKVM